MSKKYWTLIIQYDVDDEPCDPPPHIEDRMIMLMQVMHEYGFGMELKFGYATSECLDMIDMEEEE